MDNRLVRKKVNDAIKYLSSIEHNDSVEINLGGRYKLIIAKYDGEYSWEWFRPPYAWEAEAALSICERSFKTKSLKDFRRSLEWIL
jgi:hypothetical protein